METNSFIERSFEKQQKKMLIMHKKTLFDNIGFKLRIVVIGQQKLK
jgi:hypothetical protein